jgi:hypothetical protein
MFLEVTKADYLQDYKIRLEFNEGTVMLVDLGNERRF